MTGQSPGRARSESSLRVRGKLLMADYAQAEVFRGCLAEFPAAICWLFRRSDENSGRFDVHVPRLFGPRGTPTVPAAGLRR
jgi:hypothetical protein